MIESLKPSATFWQRVRDRAFMVSLGVAAYAVWAAFISLLVLLVDHGKWSIGWVILGVLPLLGYSFAGLVAGVAYVWVWVTDWWTARVSPWWTARHSKFVGVGVLVAYMILAVVEPRAAQGVATVLGRIIYGLVLYVVPWAAIFGIYQLHLAWQRYQFKQQVELERRVAEEVERQLQLRVAAAQGSTADPSREQPTTP